MSGDELHARIRGIGDVVPVEEVIVVVEGLDRHIAELGPIATETGNELIRIAVGILGAQRVLLVEVAKGLALARDYLLTSSHEG